MKLGMVDLETSHPKSWLPILRETGDDVVCVYDGGTVYPAGYAREFAAENGIARACERVDEMVGEVDAAIIHSVNWDLHVERARPFVEAGIPVLIDKPMVGNLADARTLIRWQANGAVITGGSSLRHCYEVQELLARPREELGEIHTAFTGCAVDDYNYGIHAFSLLAGIMGPGIASARYLGGGPPTRGPQTRFTAFGDPPMAAGVSTRGQSQFELVWSDGRRGIVTVGENPGYLPLYATVLTTRKVVHFTVQADRLYRAFLEHELPILKRKAKPLDLHELLEPELAAIAGLVSRNSRGRHGGPQTHLEQVNRGAGDRS